MFKVSCFTVPLSIFPASKDVVLLNTATKALLPISKENWSKIQSSKFSSLDPLFLSCLRELHMVVDDSEDELEFVKRTIEQIQEHQGYLGLTLTTTYACNCRCAYCYESDMHTDTHMMDATTVNLIQRWATSFCESFHVRFLDVCYHGGEPLLNLPFILYMSQEFAKLSSRLGITLKQSIVTNGTLLTTPIVNMLVSCGIKTVMISVDGPPQVHDKRRPYWNGKSTFKDVMDNISNIKDLFDIILSVNVDGQNASSAFELLHILERKGLKKCIKISFPQVKPGMDHNAHCSQYELNPQTAVKWIGQLYRTAVISGFSTDDVLGLGFCTRRRLLSYVIDPRGNLFDCITGVGRDGFKVGTLNDAPEDVITKRRLRLRPLKPNAQSCLTCAYWPLCLGGCSEQAFVKHGSINACDCRKDFFDNWFPVAAKIKLLQEILSKAGKAHT